MDNIKVKKELARLSQDLSIALSVKSWGYVDEIRCKIMALNNQIK